jgi:heme exporter protein A
MLRFDNVTLRRGGRLLFQAMNLVIAEGDAVRIIGPNGSGKSSLLRLAAGLLRAERGTIERGDLAFADDHLALDRELPLGRALGFWSGNTSFAMDALGLAHLADVPVRWLSSGQSKRATLARAIASGAPLWLLDEPLNALDADGAQRLSGLIDHHRSNGGAVLAASHQPLAGDWRQLELGGW